MNKQTLNFKQSAALLSLIENSTMLQFGYDSSSKDFDTKLRNIGVVSPVQLYHEYNVPGGKIGTDYELHIQKFVYLLTVFDPRQILDMVNYYLDLVRPFYKYGGQQVGDIRAAQYEKDIQNIDAHLSKLSADETQGLVEYIQNIIPDARKDALQEVAKLKQLNPQLQSVRVDTKDMSAVCDFLQGVAYGFAPEELDYFLNTPMNQRNAETRVYIQMLEKYNADPTYIVRPDRLKQISDAVMRVAGLGKEIQNGI